MRIVPLDKKVFIIGPDAAEFLNGLTSNTLNTPLNAFLTIHGRVIATFEQLPLADDRMLLCIEAPYVARLQDHLARYLTLGQRSMEARDLHVYHDLDNTWSTDGDEEYVIPQKAGQLVITPRVMERTVDEATYRLFRLTHHIPRQGEDYQDEFILNIHPTDYVSYTKGCFLGQEPVSKVHHRSRPSRRLAVVRADECSPEQLEKMTSRTEDPRTGQGLGFLFVNNREE